MSWTSIHGVVPYAVREELGVPCAVVDDGGSESACSPPHGNTHPPLVQVGGAQIERHAQLVQSALVEVPVGRGAVPEGGGW